MLMVSKTGRKSSAAEVQISQGPPMKHFSPKRRRVREPYLPLDAHKQLVYVVTVTRVAWSSLQRCTTFITDDADCGPCAT